MYYSGHLRGSKSIYSEDDTRKRGIPRKGVICGNYLAMHPYFEFRVKMLPKLAQQIASRQVRPTEAGAIGF